MSHTSRTWARPPWRRRRGNPSFTNSKAARSSGELYRIRSYCSGESNFSQPTCSNRAVTPLHEALARENATARLLVSIPVTSPADAVSGSDRQPLPHPTSSTDESGDTTEMALASSNEEACGGMHTSEEIVTPTAPDVFSNRRSAT